MRRAALALLIVLLGLPVQAQDQTGGQVGDGTAAGDQGSTLPEANAPPERYVSAAGARVRVLDKLTATTTDLDLKAGVAQTSGRIALVMDDCRYPADNPPSDAYVHLTITGQPEGTPLFQGWMIASAPALSALDHPRYDVWVLGCDLPAN